MSESQTFERVAIWDGWRGLAIALVLFGHFTFTKWVWDERMGVDVFFVLSGMLMSNILFIKRMSLKDFYIRRASRIMPALIFFLIGAYVASVAVGYDFKHSEFIGSLFFIRTYWPIEPDYYTAVLPTGHLWSLNVEEHAYILMSLISLVLLARRSIGYLLIGIYVLSVAICFYHYSVIPTVDMKSALIRTETTIGFIMFSAGYALIKKQLNLKLGQSASLICLALAFLTYLSAVPIWTTFVFSPILLGIAVNHLTDSSRGLNTILLSAPMRQLGILSFSIYLWQQIFYKLYYALPFGALTGFIASIVVGAISYYIVEKPIRNYINNRWSNQPTYREGSQVVR